MMMMLMLMTLSFLSSQSLYNYYYHRGITPIIGKGIVELVSLFFTLWLSVFLFAYLDWRALLQCVDEDSCHDSFRDYIIEKVCFYCMFVVCLLYVCCMFVVCLWFDQFFCGIHSIIVTNVHFFYSLFNK